METDEGFITRCKGCGKIINKEELITIFEDRGLSRGKEEIVLGYKCECGHEEEY